MRGPRKTPTRREQDFAQGIAQGKSQEQAALDANYAASTARKKAFAIVQRPCVRSFLTDEIEKEMARRGLDIADFIRPYLDGLKAMHVVTHSESLTVVETNVPDIGTRMDAADRIVNLYGGRPREVEMPPPQRLPLMVVIEKESDAKATPPVNSTPTTSPKEAPSFNHRVGHFDVTFLREE